MPAPCNQEVVHPAVVRLAQGTDRVRRLLAERPVLMAEALLGGAMPEHVAVAAGLDVEELRVAVSRWAARERQARRLPEQAGTELINRVFGPASW